MHQQTKTEAEVEDTLKYEWYLNSFILTVKYNVT
jgi:hypothetical protein